MNNDQFAAKFGAELASGNLPDIMFLSPAQFEDMYSQGGLGDLSETYAKYTNEGIDGVVNFDGKLINAGMRDGKLYGLPMATHPAQYSSQMYYDMNKLKLAGIESIDQLPKTIAEFEALCDKLMTLDLDGNGQVGEPVIPVAQGWYNEGLTDFSPFFHAYEAWPNTWYDDGQGNLIEGGIQDKVKTVLTKLNEWYNKGYFANDFAAQNVWAANSPLVADVVAGKFAIVPGSWWIPNWPLNDAKKNDAEMDWVVGPQLSATDAPAKVMLPRYPVNYYVAVSYKFEHPEALFKMMNWSLEYTQKISNPVWRAAATPEELLEANSSVYLWMPYRIHAPNGLIDNFDFVAKKAAENSTELAEGEALNNNEFWSSWNNYLETAKGNKDAAVWGWYTSRLSPTGGVARMKSLYETADVVYDEAMGIITPSISTKSGEMIKLRSNTFLSMVMGEIPLDDFDKYVEQWRNLGGNDIEKELNEWYKESR